MKNILFVVTMFFIAGCTSMELGWNTNEYEGRWVKVTEGDTNDLSGFKRVKLCLAEDQGRTGDFNKFIAENGLPDYLYVMDVSRFRTAYASRSVIHEWDSSPYRIVKTYMWQNYPYELPTATASAKPVTTAVAKPKPAPAEPSSVPSSPTPATGGQAQYETGMKYQQGDGVEQSDAEAARWFRKAADQGHADAQYQLGILYLNGWGVGRDAGEAGRWLRKAASQGHAQARAKLVELDPTQGGPVHDPEPETPQTEPGAPGLLPMPD